MSLTDGFSILRNWKTFRSALWHVKSPRAFGGDCPVFVAEVSERKRSLVLEFAGVSELVDLKGARFEDVPLEDVPFADRDRYVRFLEITFANGTIWLLGESRPAFSGEPIM
jgi:hypothetical protein